ncbi:MAG: zinc-ribbon domain-containing protein [Candidatus Coatesbacteria bacterium]|nr:zinc-ribbon domain-containing protein [Candidatus Coatesbacteria bacterium]
MSKSRKADPLGQPVCPNCGTPLEKGANFCIMCGTPRPEEEATCPSCGKPIKDSDIFCGNCGMRLRGEVAKVEARMDPEEEAKLQGQSTDSPITLSELLAVPPKLPADGIIVRKAGTGTKYGPGTLERIQSLLKKGLIEGEDAVGTGDGRWWLIKDHPQLCELIGVHQEEPAEVKIELAAPRIEPETKRSTTEVSEEEAEELPPRPGLIPADNIYIYLIDSKKEMGPMSYATLVKYIRNGTLAKHDYIYSTKNRWTSFRDLLKEAEDED